MAEDKAYVNRIQMDLANHMVFAGYSFPIQHFQGKVRIYMDFRP